MNPKKLLKKLLILSIVLAVSVPFIVLGGYRFAKGGWLDRAFSAYLTSRTGHKVRLYDVNFPTLGPIVRFGILSVMDQRENKVLFVSGAGSVRLLSGPVLGNANRRFKVRLEDAVIMEDLYHKNPLIDWASRQAFNRPVSLRSIEALFKTSGTGIVARIVSCRSDTLLVKGGVVLKANRILKVHLLVLLPEERFEKVPKEMRARMVRRKGGWRGVRLVYANNILTAAGDSGPFFQAQWNHGQG